ncbi:alpha/beta hydrolase family esterase [Kaarinaea lacus]
MFTTVPVTSVLFLVMVLPLLTVNESHAGLLKNQELDVNGLTRTYDIYIPEGLSDQKLPMVLLLHGHIGDADVMTGENGRKAPYKVWLQIAEREKWIVVIPEGEIGPDGHRGWNDCRANATTNPTVNDVAFIDLLITSVSRRYPADSQRVFAHGTSNGGNMVYRLAQERGERFRALAAVVAAMPEINKCNNPEHPISLLIMNGTDDPLLPYAGGGVGKRKSQQKERGTVLSTEQTVQYWLKHNNIQSAPEITDLPDRDKGDDSVVQVRKYSGGRNNAEVILYEVKGGGHTEPSLNEHYGRLYKLIVGPQNRDMEMAEEVWKFFNRHM